MCYMYVKLFRLGNLQGRLIFAELLTQSSKLEKCIISLKPLLQVSGEIRKFLCFVFPFNVFEAQIIPFSLFAYVYDL